MNESGNVKTDPQTYAVIGAAMEVHKVLGPGFLEAVYQETLTHEFTQRGIPFEREKQLSVKYKDTALSCGYRADFVCYGDVLVELKALDHLSNIELAQMINYLKATGYQRGVLLNFGAPSLDHRRVINSKAFRPKGEKVT